MTEKIESLNTKQKSWTKWEIIYFISSLLFITICFLISPSKSILSFITSLFGVTTVFLLAKGIFFAPFFDFTFNILYAIVSVVMCYYGEAIIYILIMTPITISSFFSWLKNKKEYSITVKVNKISKKEWFYLAIATVVSTIAFYFLLKSLNTRELIVSTISLISSMIGSYLILRRSAYYALFFLFDDIVSIVLWGLSISSFGLMYLPTIVSFCIFLFNDLYGFIKWKKNEKPTK